MKKRIVWVIGLLLAPLMVAYASPAQANSGLSINLPGFGLSIGHGGVGVNIGLPWVVAPAPVYDYDYDYPDRAYQPVVTEVVPEFVQPPELGFYVAVGVPYDLFYYNNSYFVNRGNVWYNSSYYNGPWAPVYSSNIPYAFNRYPFERIRHYRDTYYGRYQRSGAWVGYNHFKPGHREEYRRGPGRDRSDYARPYNQNRSYQNSSRQDNRRGYTADRQTSRERNFRNNRTITRSDNRPADFRPRGTAPKYDSRPAQVRSPRYAPDSGNKVIHTRSNTNVQSHGNRYSNSRPYAANQQSERKGFRSSPNSRTNSNNGWLGDRR